MYKGVDFTETMTKVKSDEMDQGYVRGLRCMSRALSSTKTSYGGIPVADDRLSCSIEVQKLY